MELQCQNVTHLHMHQYPEILLLMHGVFIILGGSFLAVQFICKLNHLRSKYRPRYPGHIARWAGTTVLLVLQVVAVLFGFLTAHRFDSPSNWELYLPFILGLIGTIFSTIYCHYAETNANPKALLFVMLYWIAGFGLQFLQFIGYIKQNETVSNSIGFHLNWLMMCAYMTLVSTEIYVIVKERYLSCSYQPPCIEDDLSEITYIHPYTNLLSQTTWHWINRFLLHGYKHTIQLEDLGVLPQSENVQHNYAAFRKAFLKEKKRSGGVRENASLWRCIFEVSWPMITLAGLYKLLSDLLLYVAPFTLDFMVSFVAYSLEETTNSSSTNNDLVKQKNNLTDHCGQQLTVADYFSNGYVLAVLTLIAVLAQGVLFQNNVYHACRQGIRCKGALQAMVYSKTLGLSTQGMTEGGTTQGQILNHMSVDPLNIYLFFYFGHFVWTLPIQVLTGFALLYVKLGVSALISGLLIVLMVPLQYVIGSRLARVQKKIMEQADERLKKCNEVLQSIKLLKLYAWEAMFTKSITETRKKELSLVLRAGLLRVVSIFICDGGPVAAALITFCIYPYLEKKPLEAGKVFSGLALFVILNIPLFNITMVMNAVSHAAISTRRLRDFLFTQEGLKCESQEPMAEEQIMDETNLILINKTGDLNHSAEKECFLTGRTLQQNLNIGPKYEVTNTFTDTQQIPDQGLTDLSGNSTPVTVKKHASTIDMDIAVEIKNGSFSWDLENRTPVIKDMELEIKRGEFTMIVGPVGSGKSSLLLALLGEMTTISGCVAWQKDLKIAYVPQKAWITNATLQNNILFGKELDHEAYNHVLDVCALQPDIEILVAGDQTEIGEKGVNLSGGQKQRVSIARALYAGTDVVILDDPLSALDAHVGQHVLNEAIIKSMLANKKTVILATHQVHVLSHAHKIVVLSGGKMMHQGQYKDIMLQVPDLTETLQKSHSSRKESEIVNPYLSSSLMAKDQDPTTTPSAVNLGSHSHLAHFTPGVVRSAVSLSSLPYLDPDEELSTSGQKAREQPACRKEYSYKNETMDAVELGRLVEDEERSGGSVTLGVYLHYLKAGTLWLSLGAIALYSTRQVMRIIMDFWLAEWSEAAIHAASREFVAESDNGHSNSSNLDQSDSKNNYDLTYYMSIYALYAVISMVLCALSILCLEIMAVVAAKNLFKRMLEKIVRAPMRFFDTTPIGRIINRCAGDTNMIDEKMVISWDQVLFCLVFVLAGIGVNAFTTPYFILPAVVVFTLYLAIQRFYIATSRELNRLDNITKSPVLAHFSETLGGLTTIRAYREQKRFQETNWKYIEDNNAAFLFRETANVWMGIRLDFLGAMIIFSAAISSITTGIYGGITPAVVGLSIAYAVMISSFLNWLMKGMSELEMWFNAVERVLYYSKIKTEPQTQNISASPVPAEWPKTGDILFKNVSLRYDASLPSVVQNVDIQIKSGQKVGICGRTGSGKSSLSLSLFRLVDICEGQIQVGGHDITGVPLDRLRASLSIIPQDPVLFSGSVRYNLDPNEMKSDEDIWNAIEIAQLRDTIFNLPQKINAPVTEGGENFSAGQRQLFCLARAFLRRSPVIVMDEATASIDSKTDSVIQQVIQNAFTDSTVLIIAHRIHTIMNCDQIIVLQDGRVIEHDKPAALLANKDSVFLSMVEQNKI